MYAADEDAPTINGGDADSITESMADYARHFGEAARQMAEIRIESADNMEDGFGHETAISGELREQGEQAETVADELEYYEPSYEAPTIDTIREDLEGTDQEDGTDEDLADCLKDRLDEWANEMKDEIDSIWQGVQV